MKKPEKPCKIIQDIKKYADVLNKLIEEKKYGDFSKIEDTSYPYFEEWKYKTKDWNFSLEELWTAVKMGRMGKKTIYFSQIHGFTFSFNTPSIIQQYLHELDLNLGGSLQSDNLIPNQEKDRYLVSSIMEEAIASSQIEGAVTTRKVAKEMLEKHQNPKNVSEKMILNNYNTMMWIVANKEKPMSLDFLLNVHRAITRDTLKDKNDEGRLRTNDNVKVMDETNEIFYIPPEQKYLEELINAFIQFANDEKQDHIFIHPIIKAIILHFLIGYIHPFADGNGRTARAIFYWYLLKKGYWLIEYMSVSRIILRAKAQYARAYLYTEYDENDLTYFILYNLKAINSALDELKSYVNQKTQEKQQIISLLKHTNFNDRQILIIQDLLKDKNEYFNVKQIESRFNISNQTARNDLSGLVDSGILITKLTGNKANYFAVADFEKKIMK